jgi:PAS domain S-box-containing protein
MGVKERMNRIVDVRRIFDSVTEIWILADKDGVVLLKSGHLEKFQHVISPPIAEGVSLLDSIPANWRALAGNVLQTLQHSRVPSILEASYTDASGKETHFEVKATGMRDDAGELKEIFVEARDVTPQKIFEKKITIVAREYQSVIENANAVIIGTDARGYITEWNEMAWQVTGYSKNESYIRKLTDFLRRESQEGFSHAMNRVLAGQVATNYEMIFRAKDDRTLTLLINATPRTSAIGEVVGTLLIGQDITELSAYRKSLEQQVAERTRALKSALESEKQLVEVKDRFVSMASHEFRSPISYIHRNIGAIMSHIETLSTAEVKERMSKIQSQADHLTSLLEDVLTMGKTGATNTKIKANLNRVDLKEFLHRIIDEVQSNTQHTHRIQLDFRFDELCVRSDENLLRNIFVNLLTNAIKFSPGKTEVQLSVEGSHDQVVCRVRDFGLGIGGADLPRIFEPFHRGENVRQIKGTGLGLPIVKKAVETLGGEVDVQSTAGEGTLFTVKLNLDNA